MVRMVFVHGVTVRVDGDYQRNVAARDRRFTTEAFADAKVHIENPYWGKFGAVEPIRAIPGSDEDYVSLGVGAESGDADPSRAPDLILQAAREDFAGTIAALSVGAIENADGVSAEIENQETIWAEVADYAESLPRSPGAEHITLAPEWLNHVSDDAEFFDALRQAVEEHRAGASLGLGDDLKEAASGLAGGFSNLVNGPFARIGRERLTPRVSVFVGDVFRYLKAGAGFGDIRKAVLQDIKKQARAAAESGEKLVLAGHSMGAVILYDLLSDTAVVNALSAELGKPLKVDLFLSVGSQIAIFEEMKVFTASQGAPGSPAKTKRPACVERWWNVWDKMDVLSFLAENTFDGVQDYRIDTIAGVKDAHGAYFLSSVFYKRLNKRMRAQGLIP